MLDESDTDLADYRRGYHGELTAAHLVPVSIDVTMYVSHTYYPRGKWSASIYQGPRPLMVCMVRVLDMRIDRASYLRN